MDMDSGVCRACGELADLQVMQDLREFSDIYYNLTSITVYKSEDGCCPKVCDGCRLKLQQFDEFRSLCIRVHEHLLQNADRLLIPAPPGDEPEKDDKLSLEVKESVISSTDDPEDLWNTPFTTDYVEFCQPIDYEHLKEAAKTEDQQLSNDDEGAESREEDHELQPGPARNDSEKLLDSVTVPIKGRGIFLFVCHVCHTKFKTETRLNGHLRAHQGLKPAVCTICGKEFIKWFNLKMHIRNKHMNEQQQRFPCDFPGCSLTYTTMANMRKHRKTHDPNHVNRGMLKYICEQCGKSYTTFGALKAHTYSHTGNLPFSCTMCDRKFVNADKLRIHMMRHQGIKNYECPHCGIKKTTKTELRTHINYHTKERKIPCSTCGLAFASSGNLARHVRIVHRGIKEFQCTHCGQSFGKAETLKHHVMTHTGERPHGCTECDKRFIQLVALRKHMKTHSLSRKRANLAVTAESVKPQRSDKE